MYIWFFSLICAGGSPAHSSQLVPLNPSGPWAPLELKHLSCPKSEVSHIGPEEEQDMIRSIRINRPTVSSEVTVPGYLCVRWEMMTTCSRSVLFSDSIFHTMTQLPVSIGLCDLERDHNQSPELIFPDADCQWMKTTKQVAIITTFHPTNAYYTPGSWSIRVPDHPHVCIPLLGCNAGQSIWMNTSDPYKNCLASTMVDFVIQVNTGRNKMVRFNSLFYHVSDLMDSCLVHFCGDNGLRLSNGEWMSLSDELRDLLGDDRLAKISPCDERVSKFINVGAEDDTAERVLETTVMELEYLLCLDRLERIKETNAVTTLDIYHLIPKTPSNGRVYQLRGDTWYTSMTSYVIAFWDSSEQHHPGYMGTDAKGTHLFWNSIYRDGEKYTGPNGFEWRLNGSVLTRPINAPLFTESDIRYRKILLSTPPPTRMDLYSQYTRHVGISTSRSVQSNFPEWGRFCVLVGGLLVVLLMIILGLKGIRCIPRKSNGCEKIELKPSIQEIVDKNTHLSGPELEAKIIELSC